MHVGIPDMLACLCGRGGQKSSSIYECVCVIEAMCPVWLNGLGEL